MAGIARGRLAEERRNWRKDHPFGFVARPMQSADGSTNLLEWECIVPGVAGTDFEGGFFPVTLKFSEDYPSKPPHCSFPQNFFHPNIYPSGKVCLSIINEDQGWKPSITVKQILLGIQDLLDNPNNADPAQEAAYHMLSRDKAEYKRYQADAMRALSRIRHSLLRTPFDSRRSQSAGAALPTPARPLRVMVLAGEPSGDLLGARVMRSLVSQYPGSVQFEGCGGPQMEGEGLRPLVPFEDLAVMGLVELLPHIPRLLRHIGTVSRAAGHPPLPDAVVSIDAKGFTYRVLEKAKHGWAATGVARPPPCLHYVAPSVWAYRSCARAGEVAKLSRLVDHLMCLLPFEPALFQAGGLPATFVGHPVAEDCLERAEDGVPGAAGGGGVGGWTAGGDGAAFRESNGLAPRGEGEAGGGGDDAAPLLCVLPGSRAQEVRRHLPLFRETVATLLPTWPSLRCVILTVPSVEREVRAGSGGWPGRAPPLVIEDAGLRYDVFAACDAALAVSGTVVSELSAARLPTVVAYRASWLTEVVARRLARVRHVSLPNILLDDDVIPEALFSSCTARAMAPMVARALADPEERARQARGMAAYMAAVAPPSDDREWLRGRWGIKGGAGTRQARPSEIAAASILSAIAL